MTVSRESLLFSALMGTSDCPMSGLLSLQARLDVEGNTTAAAYTGKLIAAYTQAESRIIAVASAMPFDTSVAEKALQDHRFVVSSIQTAMAQHAVVEA